MILVHKNVSFKNIDDFFKNSLIFQDHSLSCEDSILYHYRVLLYIVQQQYTMYCILLLLSMIFIMHVLCKEVKSGATYKIESDAEAGAAVKIFDHLKIYNFRND